MLCDATLGYHIVFDVTVAPVLYTLELFPYSYPDTTFGGLFPSGLPAELLDLPEAPVSIEVQPQSASLAVSETADFAYNAFDAASEPAHLSPSDVTWDATGAIGALSPNGVFQYFVATAPGAGQVTATMDIAPNDAASSAIEVTE